MKLIGLTGNRDYSRVQAFWRLLRDLKAYALWLWSGK